MWWLHSFFYRPFSLYFSLGDLALNTPPVLECLHSGWRSTETFEPAALLMRGVLDALADLDTQIEAQLQLILYKQLQPTFFFPFGIKGLHE